MNINYSRHPCCRHRAWHSLRAMLAPVAGFAPVVSAAIIATNPPAQPLTAARIAALPSAQQPAWNQCLERSNRQMQADLRFLQKEMRLHGVKETIVAPSGSTTRSLPLNRSAAWYGGAEGRRIADIVISFQTPAGGWSKNLDLSRQGRAPGETFGPDNVSRRLGPADFDTPHNTNWNYVGTFDNDATITELRYLAKVVAAAGPFRSASYRAAFLRGLDYIFAAQYPNGGWPQVWPLEGGYHDAITFNDGAMINLLGFLRDVSEATNEFAFVTARTRAQATVRLKRGIECVLATQIVVDGRRTVWCQQHDPLTLQPVSGRNYEMPSQSGSESAGVMVFLMQLPKPSPRVITAVRSAAAWFEKTKISDVAYRRDGDNGRLLVPAPGAGPLWARYYEIGTDRPIFGDRDKSIHDDLNEISLERRNGYSWYATAPKQVLGQYVLWSKAHP